MAQGDREDTVIRLESAQQAIRVHFLGWQCRMRQHAIRHGDGRPGPAMQPDIEVPEAGTLYGSVAVLIVQTLPQTITAELRHMFKSTQDPQKRLESVLRYLSSNYFQDSSLFSDRMTALFGPSSQAARTLLEAGKCRLLFSEKGQSYRLPATVRPVPRNDPFWEATFWHNSLFNPNLPGEVEILGFEPNWATAEADPEAY